MGDSDKSKRKAIPSWQRLDSNTSASNDQASSQEQSEEISPLPNREPLLEQAAKFLEDEDIRTAPIERKRFFLGSKGLTEGEIEDLLQGQESPQEQHTPEAEVMEDYGIEKEALNLQRSQSQPTAEKDSIPPPDASELEDTAPSMRSSTKQLPPTGPRSDQPPIITYPEFLLHSQKPPPLVSAQRLLTTFYVASGAAATVYGTSKYILEPMIESLTSGRHSLAQSASTNLDVLNTKLESSVSKLPKAYVSADPEEFPDDGSTDSDPSRFFNRSAGTQTSPHISRSPSSTSLEAVMPLSPIEDNETTLSTIHSKLSDLRPLDTTDAVKESIRGLQKYLNHLPYAQTSPRNARLWDKADSDEYGRLKAEIRGVKGVLLSARNFPSSVSVR